jgi:hypothetical protein
MLQGEAAVQYALDNGIEADSLCDQGKRIAATLERNEALQFRARSSRARPVQAPRGRAFPD